MSLFSVLMRPAPQSRHFKDFLSQLSVMGTYVRPSIKKILFAVTLPRFFRWVGTKVNMHVVLLFFCIIIVVVCCSFFREGH